MTVAELIDVLSRCDQTAEVRMDDCERCPVVDSAMECGGHGRATTVMLLPSDAHIETSHR